MIVGLAFELPCRDSYQTMQRFSMPAVSSVHQHVDEVSGTATAVARTRRNLG